MAGYQAHLRAEEPTCQACKEAKRFYTAAWRVKNHTRKTLLMPGPEDLRDLIAKLL